MKSYRYIFTFLAGLMLSAALLRHSPGVTVHDEIGHFLLAKAAWQHPVLLLDLWGRPLNTLLFMLPAQGGLLPARVFALVLSAAAVLLTTEVARHYGLRRLYWIPLLLWFQPWFLTHSFEAVTEVPFLFLLILAVFLSVRDRQKWAGLVWGMLPLVRHEGILLTGLWLLLMLCQRRWAAAALALLPLTVFNLLYLAVHGIPAVRIYLRPKPTEFYGRGNWWHYLPRMAYYAGLPVTMLALFSLPVFGKTGIHRFYPGVYVAYFVAHAVIFRLGLYASGGYSIFLFPLAPMLAVAAALGWEWLHNRMPAWGHGGAPARNAKKWMQFSPELVIILCVLANAAAIARPKPLDAEAAAIRDAAIWLKNREFRPENIITANVWGYYFADIPCRPGQDWRRQHALPEIAPGSVVIWDRHYAERRGLILAQMKADPQNWQPLAAFGEGAVFIFLKRPETGQNEWPHPNWCRTACSGKPERPGANFNLKLREKPWQPQMALCAKPSLSMAAESLL